MGNFKGTLGSPRYPRSDCGLRNLLDEAGGGAGMATRYLAWDCAEQIPHVETSLRQSEFAQWKDLKGLLA